MPSQEASKARAAVRNGATVAAKVREQASRSASGAATIAAGLAGVSSNGTSEGATAQYVLPVVHIHLPEKIVNLGFWGALAGTAAFGVIDAPLAILIGAGVVIARHRARSK